MAVTKYIEEDLYKDLKPEYQYGTEFIEIDDLYAQIASSLLFSL